MPRIATLRFGRAYIFALVAVAFIGWGLYAAIDALRPPMEVHVRLAAGSSVTRRFQLAETLADAGRKHNLYMEVLATAGHEESFRSVICDETDLTLISSGLEASNSKDIRVLAGFGVAPLHILARRAMVENGLSLTAMIKGHRVNLGPVGTNDFLLSRDVVKFLRLTPLDSSGQGDFTAFSLSKEELAKLAQDVQSQTGAQREASLQAMPEVIMTVASLPGVLVQEILDTGEYCLIPFPNAEPFLMSELQHISGTEDRVNRLLVEPASIHAGMYLGNSLTPAKDCPTIGLRTLLVADVDLPRVAVERIMQSIFETEFSSSASAVARGVSRAYPIHEAAQAYLDRDKPLVTGKLFESISKFLSIFGAFSAGALSLYGYIRRRRIRRPGEYLEEIRQIDALAFSQAETETQLSPEAMAKEIDARLNQLKEQVIRDYCENRVQGEMVLLSILSTLADSRTRLHAVPGRPNGFKPTVQDVAVPWPGVPSDPQSSELASKCAA